MSKPEEITRRALTQLADDLDLDVLENVSDEFDIFAAIDSFAIVELLMLTETELEQEAGKYIPLADEKIFDAEKSPLRCYGQWVAYVGEALENA